MLVNKVNINNQLSSSSSSSDNAMDNRNFSSTASQNILSLKADTIWPVVYVRRVLTVIRSINTIGSHCFVEFVWQNGVIYVCIPAIEDPQARIQHFSPLIEMYVCFISEGEWTIISVLHLTMKLPLLFHIHLFSPSITASMVFLEDLYQLSSPFAPDFVRIVFCPFNRFTLLHHCFLSYFSTEVEFYWRLVQLFESMYCFWKIDWYQFHKYSNSFKTRLSATNVRNGQGNNNNNNSNNGNSNQIELNNEDFIEWSVFDCLSDCVSIFSDLPGNLIYTRVNLE
jgi:hypothetical protein